MSDDSSSDDEEEIVIKKAGSRRSKRAKRVTEKIQKKQAQKMTNEMAAILDELVLKYKLVNTTLKKNPESWEMVADEFNAYSELDKTAQQLSIYFHQSRKKAYRQKADDQALKEHSVTTKPAKPGSTVARNAENKVDIARSKQKATESAILDLINEETIVKDARSEAVEAARKTKYLSQKVINKRIFQGAPTGSDLDEEEETIQEALESHRTCYTAKKAAGIEMHRFEPTPPVSNHRKKHSPSEEKTPEDLAFVKPILEMLGKSIAIDVEERLARKEKEASVCNIHQEGNGNTINLQKENVDVEPKSVILRIQDDMASLTTSVKKMAEQAELDRKLLFEFLRKFPSSDKQDTA